MEVPPSPSIHIENLVVRYGSFVAVNGLNLALYPGELFGLLGPNGAGKSSTIRVLIGQRKPTSGSVKVCGLDVVREWSAVKPLFGYVPDRENLFDEFTGRRNLQIFAGLYQVSGDRVGECLKMVELSDVGDRVVRGYSMGMRRKLLLARALLHDPEVLYLDEPTANLDLYSSELVHRILRQRVKAGKTVLLTTHNMVEVEKICDRVAIVCRGRVVALDTPLNLRQNHTERKVDVVLHSGERVVLDLEAPADRERLAEFVREHPPRSMHTREFDFHSTFLKLTGQIFE